MVYSSGCKGHQQASVALSAPARRAQGPLLGGLYTALASQGASGLKAQLSMVHVAPAWHPIVQPPLGQLRMVQVAPVAHWIWQPEAAQVSSTQVDPVEQ
jgi:hypothetical protein